MDLQPNRTGATGPVFQDVLKSAKIFFDTQNTKNFTINTKNNSAKFGRVL
jgi:hypothetical protein